ncbi:MAG: hypothetical protein OS130_13640 [Thermodesulfobacteriota bacterium]|jgi:hypothetical protein|nr:MAG: hypothetical protein OS130_13640 [Thermodesulfobacteriota bacterium]
MRKGFFCGSPVVSVCLIGVMLLSAVCISPVQAAGGVSINGVLIPPETIQQLETQYGVRILDGDFWYDKYSGAWGFMGGPCMGQVLPFLELGGPLNPNCSNGNTGVFINGRHLHAQDVYFLYQITGVVIPGRYWCDTYGNVGFEGGPAIFNLYSAAQVRFGGGGQKEGILSSYDKTGIAVIGGN